MNGGPHGPVRVVVVDDHPAFRVAAATMLSLDPRFSLVGEAADPAGALVLLGRLASAGTACHLALVDVNLGVGDGMALAAEIVARHPGTAVLTCSTAPRHELPDLPDHPDVGYLPKVDLDAERLWAWLHRDRRRHPDRRDRGDG